YEGWDARVFQHEHDHLEGILFPYRAADPRHLVTLEELGHRQDWPADWPAPGARDAEMGTVTAE
ncbi:MAG: peptide deformylase, partial [bacterium]